MDTIRDELRECCSKQLNTRLVQMNGPTVLGSSNETDLLERVKAIAVKGVHKEVHRAAFQGMHQQQGEMYQAYAARLKAKADLGQYSIKAQRCGDDLCSCSGHGRQLYYRDEMVGTQLVAGAYNKEHQAKLLSESASMLTLQDKLDRLCTLEKSESSSATLSGQVQLSAGVKEVEVKKVEATKCSSCHRFHKMCGKCKRVHPCTIECYNCHKKGHVSLCCPAPKNTEKSKVVGEVHETVVGGTAFCMELVAMEFMAGQEMARVNREHKRARQRTRKAVKQGEEEESSICQVDRRHSSFSSYSDRRSSGYTSDCGDRRNSNYEDRLLDSISLEKSPSFCNYSPLAEYRKKEENNPRISIEETESEALVAASTKLMPGMQNVPDWLKSLRLHKYTNLIMSMDYQEMLELTEEKLEKMNVTKGAARKIANSIQKLKERPKLLHELNANVDTGICDIRKILADLESILQSPINIENRLKTPDEGQLLIEQIVVTMRKVCSYLLLSSNTDPKNGKSTIKKYSK